jgi:hypothetical protein
MVKLDLERCPVCGETVGDSAIRDSETGQSYHFNCWRSETSEPTIFKCKCGAFAYPKPEGGQWCPTCGRGTSSHATRIARIKTAIRRRDDPRRGDQP